MQRILVLSVACLWATGASAQVQKCTMPDGRIVYSDTACPTSSRDAAVVIKKPAATVPTDKLPPPVPVAFTGTPATDYIKASALMDNIRVIGRDCEWALKVDNTKIQKCIEFMGKLQPGGEYEQVSQHVTELNKDPTVAQQSISELRTITRHMQDIVRYKEFMLANLGVR